MSLELLYTPQCNPPIALRNYTVITKENEKLITCFPQSLFFWVAHANI